MSALLKRVFNNTYLSGHPTLSPYNCHTNTFYSYLINSLHLLASSLKYILEITNYGDNIRLYTGVPWQCLLFNKFSKLPIFKSVCSGAIETFTRRLFLRMQAGCATLLHGRLSPPQRTQSCAHTSCDDHFHTHNYIHSSVNPPSLYHRASLLK